MLGWSRSAGCTMARVIWLPPLLVGCAVGCDLRPLGLAAQQDGVEAVSLLQSHLDALAVRGWHILADEVGADGQLAVPAVHQDGELHLARASRIEQCVDGGASRAAGEEHVIHQHDDPILDGYWQRLRGPLDAPVALADVV